jgi:hypothetical protein
MSVYPHVKVTFKEAFTANILIYSICPNWTLEELYINVSPKIKHEFDIDPDKLDLISSHNNCIIFLGRPVETYPALPKSNIIQLKDLWGIDMKYVCIYIRKIKTESSEHGECMVCWEDTTIESYYQCGHKMCGCCYSSCLRNNMRFCPTCRNQHTR